MYVSTLRSVDEPPFLSSASNSTAVGDIVYMVVQTVNYEFFLIIYPLLKPERHSSTCTKYLRFVDEFL